MFVRETPRNQRNAQWYLVKYGGLCVLLCLSVCVGVFSHRIKERGGEVDSTLATRDFLAADSSYPVEYYGIGVYNSSSSSSSIPRNTSHHNGTADHGNECSDVSKYPSSIRCEFAKTNCGGGGYINYERYYYCWKKPYIIYPLYIVWLLLLFYLLNLSAEDFFVPALTRLSQVLHMNANIAGVTLLAFGNGAPDIFSVLAAIGTGDFGISVGEIAGAGNFVTEVVVGAVCIVSAKGSVKLPRRPFIRDCCFFLGAVVILFVFIIDGYIHIYESATMIGYYVFFVFVVISSRIIYQSMKKRKKRKSKSSSGGEPSLLSNASHLQHGSDDLVRYLDIEVDSSLNGETEDLPHHHHHYAEGNEEIRKRLMEEDDEEDDKISDQVIDWSSPHAAPEAALEKLLGVGDVVDVDRALTERLKLLEEGGSSSSGNKRSSRSRPGSRRGSKSGTFVTPSASRRGSKVIHHQQSYGSLLAPPESDLEVIEAILKEEEEGHDMGVPNSTMDLVEYDDDDPDDEDEKVEYLFLTKWVFKFGGYCADLWTSFHDQWRDRFFIFVILYFLFLPFRIAFNLTIPFTDYDKWNKVLAIVYCVTSPLFFLFCTNQFLLHVYWHIQLWMIVLCAGIILSAIVLVSSRSNKPPIYKSLFIFASFLCGCAWIYIIANEVVNILQALGLFLGISSTVLGLTVLAWGNSIGDFVADCVVARHGFPEMGITACYCAPLVNMLVGLGLGVTIQIFKKGKAFKASMHHTAYIGFIFLIISLSFDAVCMPTILRFRPGRKYGTLKVVLYAIFTVTMMLVEFKVIWK